MQFVQEGNCREPAETLSQQWLLADNGADRQAGVASGNTNTLSPYLACSRDGVEGGRVEGRCIVVHKDERGGRALLLRETARLCRRAAGAQRPDRRRMISRDTRRCGERFAKDQGHGEPSRF